MTRPPDPVSQLACAKELSDRAVVWLADHTAPVVFEDGDVLITQGRDDRDCYFIESGETEVRRDGRVLGRSGAGEPEGEVGLFFRIPRTATTTAMGEVRALRLRAADWDGLCSADPGLADHIRVGICRHLARRFGLESFGGVPRDPP